MRCEFLPCPVFIDVLVAAPRQQSAASIPPKSLKAGLRPKAIIVPGSGAKRQPSSRSRHSAEALVASLSISTSANGLGPRNHLKE